MADVTCVPALGVTVTAGGVCAATEAGAALIQSATIGPHEASADRARTQDDAPAASDERLRREAGKMGIGRAS
ncbi:MAG TPA: hypothetical protein VGI97_09520 [Gemmatimonadaceae bacterium]